MNKDGAVAVLRTMTYNDEWVYRTVYVWCQACDSIHPFRVEVNKESPTYATRRDLPVWSWNGSLTSPTFEPSLLCYGTVDTCDPDYEHFELCEFGDDCESPYHAIVWEVDGKLVPSTLADLAPEELQKRAHRLPCQRPMGNCHTFLRDGVWQYLDDCAHDMRGFHPLVPLPDWWFADEED